MRGCLFDIFPAEPAESLKAAVGEVVRSKKPAHFEYEADNNWYDASVYPIFDMRGQVTRLAVYSRDITEKKKQSQKLETLGILSGGIAHDFNNLLMGIQGYTTLMLMSASAGHPFRAYLEGTKELAASGARLTRQLLAFAKGGKEDVEPTDMNDLVGKSIEMFGRTRKEITIHRRFQKHIWTIVVDRGRIEQVLLNLFVNA
jgi:two-component system cell cycle sensor histidine kinase/response regulator CckA